ncbi:uncharacterized protein LOC128740085 [Sabethes cyaneus]|uniref:uncharacterized protein LOC128740085 n=1 Tax=Sabethes cyaneus TaxID=53552 RepID=UPI00237EC989|nr:uncharacterized protein LOC128740085 [Sabethes cyaneus]
MGTEGSPPDGGTYIGKRTLPCWMDSSGDKINTVTLLLRAVSHSDVNDSSDSSIPPTPTTPEAKLPLNPFLIEKTVDLALDGKARKLVSATKEARGNRYVLRTTSKSACDKLLAIKQLIDGTPVEVVLHPSLSFSQGIVYDADTIDFNTDTILENLVNQNVVAVRRITKKSGETIKNTPLLVLTFREHKIPAFIYYGLIRLPVRTYYPSPLLCYGCAKYGHSRKNCNQTPICLNCSTAHDQPCTNPKFCLNCNGNHGPTDRECPVYQEEVAVIKLKTDQSLTYGEARAEINNSKRCTTYSSQAQSIRPQVDGDKDRQIKVLREEVNKKNQQLEETKKLKEENLKMRTHIINTKTNNYSQEIDAIRKELNKYRDAYHATFKELAAIKAELSTNNSITLTADTHCQQQPKKAKRSENKSGDESNEVRRLPTRTQSNIPKATNLEHNFVTPPTQNTRGRNRPESNNQTTHNTRNRGNNPEPSQGRVYATLPGMDIDDATISD